MCYVYGSAYGLTEAEQSQIASFITSNHKTSQLVGGSIRFGNPESKALMFCREIGVFPMA